MTPTTTNIMGRAPNVSLIVPIRDAESEIENLVTAIGRLEYEGDFEVILVENGSSDGTRTQLRRFTKNLRCQVHIIEHATVENSYAARNVGIRVAYGDILVFTDADCCPRPAWLARLIAGFETPEIGIVAGEIEAAPGQNWIERYAERRKILSQAYTLNHPFRRYAQTANLAIRRSLLDEIGLFRPGMQSGGDADICWRAEQEGWKLRFLPEALVSHHHRSSFAGLWTQWSRYGHGHRVLQQLYRTPNSAHSEARFALAVARRALTYSDPSRPWLFRAGALVIDGLLGLLCICAFAHGANAKPSDLTEIPRLQEAMSGSATKSGNL